MKITVKPQEENSNSKFDGKLVATTNFLDTFGNDAFILAVQALAIIRTEIVPQGADYLQVCENNGTTFWLIDDGDHITALLPEDY